LKIDKSLRPKEVEDQVQAQEVGLHREQPESVQEEEEGPLPQHQRHPQQSGLQLHVHRLLQPHVPEDRRHLLQAVASVHVLQEDFALEDHRQSERGDRPDSLNVLKDCAGAVWEANPVSIFGAEADQNHHVEIPRLQP